MTKSNRIVYMDVLRVIACFSVIMIHSSGPYVIKDIGSFNFWVGNIFDGLARIGVPLFIMISGALMLDKNYQFSTQKIIKHIIRMIVFFAFWSVLYCFIFNIVGSIIKHESIDIIKIIGSLIKGHYHLWFVYLIIGLYLIVPLLRLWVNDANKKYVEYFIILSIIFTYIIPQIISIGSNYSNLFEHINVIIENNLSLKYVGGFTTYFILGWYINNYELKNKRIIYILGLFGVLITIMGTYILSNTTGKALQMYEYLYINVLFQTVAVFVIIKDKFKNMHTNNLINSISKYSLGIYAIHALIVTIMYKILEKINIDFALINIPIVFIVSFVLSYISSFILSKIPVLKKVV